MLKVKATFVTLHGGRERNLASCATCHARESCLRCHLNGASLAEVADFQIAISAEELGLPGPLTTVATFRVNYDDKPATSAIETVESELANNGWTIMGTPTENSPRTCVTPAQQVI